ncbi:MAG: dihydropyrimidinase [Pseudomonadota bacterium]
MTFDTVVHGGTLATAQTVFKADVGIRDGRIAALADALEGGVQRIDATGKFVLPGGIEAHCHIAQESAAGLMTADDYRSGSRSAALGGNTTFIPFAAQAKGELPTETLDRYAERAEGVSLIDWSNHLIVSDLTPKALENLPKAFERGIPSFKVFMTYAIRIDDRAFLDVLATAKEGGGLAMVHAENHGILDWTVERLTAAGHKSPKFHAASRPAAAEAEAIRRAIALAEFLDAPLFIVHVSTPDGAEAVREARARGVRLFSETCPQYLFLTREDLDRPGQEGAKFICSPPVRDAATQDVLWRHLRLGTFDLISSDHAPYRADATGKFANGADAPFPRIANGMPGVAARLPLMFSEGVMSGRLSLQRFVQIASAEAARIHGLEGRKGTLAIGADADLAIWDPEVEKTLSLGDMGDAMDYTPFEGRRVRGWPVRVMVRGRTVVENGEIAAPESHGRFLPRTGPAMQDIPGSGAPELSPQVLFGADIAPKSPMGSGG